MRNFFRQCVAIILGVEARLYLLRTRPIIVAVAGISNKTSVKQAIAVKLQAGGINAVAYPKSYNTEIGLPLAILQVEPSANTFIGWFGVLTKGLKNIFFPPERARVLVLEYGVSEQGDMIPLLRIAKPVISVITDIMQHPQSRVHGDVLADEMVTLLQGTAGTILMNADNEYTTMILSVAKEAGQEIQTYGFNDMATYQATNLVDTATGQEFQVQGKIIPVDKFGKHHVYAALAALAVSDILHGLR